MTTQAQEVQTAAGTRQAEVNVGPAMLSECDGPEEGRSVSRPSFCPRSKSSRIQGSWDLSTSSIQTHRDFQLLVFPSLDAAAGE